MRAKEDAFNARMRGRLNKVENDARQAVENIGSGDPQRRIAASERQRKIIDDGFAVEDALQKRLWDEVDLKQKINDVKAMQPLALAVKEIKQKFGVFADDLPRSQMAKVSTFIKKARKGTLTVNDLKQMRTNIGADIAAEVGSQTPNRRKLLALSELDDALLDVMERNLGDEKLADAIAQSRALNNHYRKGTIGKIRGFDSTGTPRVRAELTLDEIVKAEAKGDVGMDDLLIAVDSPETRATVGDYVLGLFASKHIKDGAVNVSAASAFKNKYSPVLRELPDASRLIDEAIETGRLSERVQRLGNEALNKFSQKRRALMEIVNYDDPAEVIARIASKQTKNPHKQLSDLVIAAKQDKTGNALAGLKELVADEIIESLTTTQTIGGVNLLKTDNVSGILSRKWMGALERSGLYTKEQVARLERVVKSMELNAATSQSKIKGGSDTIQNWLGNIVSLVGLKKVAPLVTKGAGPGGLAMSQRLSKLFSSLGRKIGTEDVNNMVRHAILNDPKLLHALLTRPTTVNQAEKSLKTIGVYLTTLPQREMTREEEDANDTNL